MSLTRIMALAGLVLVLAVMMSMRSAGSHAQAWLTGQCFRDPAPVACHHAGPDIAPRHYDI
jgi:hypothetical protein